MAAALISRFVGRSSGDHERVMCSNGLRSFRPVVATPAAALRAAASLTVRRMSFPQVGPSSTGRLTPSVQATRSAVSLPTSRVTYSISPASPAPAP